MKTLLSCCIILSVVFVAVQAKAQEELAVAADSLVLFDDFHDKFLDPDRWVGSEVKQDAGIEILECVRQIQGGKLRLLSRVYTDNTGSDTGSFYGSNRLTFKNGMDITAIKATVQVKDFAVGGCTSNTSPTRARARMGGSFFNTGTPTQGSYQGDVLAVIAVQRRSDDLTDAPTVLEVLAQIVHCNDTNCNNSTLLGTVDTDVLGTVKKGQNVTLLLEWDKTNHLFIFQQGKKQQGSFDYKASTSWNPSWNDTAQPGAPNGGGKRLELRHDVPNCTNTTAPPVSFMEAFFDNVNTD